MCQHFLKCSRTNFLILSCTLILGTSRQKLDIFSHFFFTENIFSWCLLQLVLSVGWKTSPVLHSADCIFISFGIIQQILVSVSAGALRGIYSLANYIVVYEET